MSGFQAGAFQFGGSQGDTVAPEPPAVVSGANYGGSGRSLGPIGRERFAHVGYKRERAAVETAQERAEQARIAQEAAAKETAALLDRLGVIDRELEAQALQALAAEQAAMQARLLAEQNEEEEMAALLVLLL